MSLSGYLGAAAALGLIAAAFVPPPTRGAPSAFSAIVVFGDSLSDTGNVLVATGVGPGEPYARGRFSNGPVWIEHVAAGLGLDVAPALTGGSNYAYGGARTGPAGDSPPSLIDQVERHLADRDVDGQALHVVLGGANDLLPLIDQAQPPNDIAAGAAVENIETVVRQLAAAGARRFLTLNMPDLGATPIARRLGPAGEARGTALARAFNEKLAATLDQLTAALPIEIVRVDLFDLHRAALDQPAAYGFDRVVDPCLSEAGICTDPERRLFWDLVHPTAAAHARLGQAVLDILETGSAGPVGQAPGG